MKKYISLLLSFISIFLIPHDIFADIASTTLQFQINNPIMIINGIEKEIDENPAFFPIIKDGRTLIPVRATAEAFGATVNWDPAERSVKIEYKNKLLKFIIDSDIAYINNEKYKTDVSPTIINDRTMLPLRAVAEGLDFNVLWDKDNSVINITDSKNVNNFEISSKWIKNGISEKSIKIHFIDVGQGDSIFCELPNGEYMLIDAGPDENTAYNYIKNLGITHIDHIIATHPDSDHITGMPKILENLTADNFYMPNKAHTSNIFKRMLKALQNNGCEARYAFAGNTILNSDDLSIVFLSPNKEYEDNNNMSAVIKITYKNISMLFTGDASHDAENDMLNSDIDLHSDLLKIAHHGSKSSTSEKFLKAISPEYAVISVGKDNTYGHPTENVLSLLDKYNVKVFRTDELGTVIAECDGNGFKINAVEYSVGNNSPPSDNSYSEDIIVYKTKTGTKYHKSDCSHINTKYEITLEQAEKEGLVPCSYCFPSQ